MEKLLEKKNLGIPATFLSLTAYLIGYYMVKNYTGLIFAILFAAIVFALDFDDKVKIAVKQSYIVAIIFVLINMLLEAFTQLANAEIPFLFLLNMRILFMRGNAYLLFFVNIAIIVIYVLFILFVLIKKDIKIGFLLKLFEEKQ